METFSFNPLSFFSHFLFFSFPQFPCFPRVPTDSWSKTLVLLGGASCKKMGLHKGYVRVLNFDIGVLFHPKQLSTSDLPNVLNWRILYQGERDRWSVHQKQGRISKNPNLPQKKRWQLKYSGDGVFLILVLLILVRTHAQLKAPHMLHFLSESYDS